MSNRQSLEEMLKLFGSACQAIDVRVAATLGLEGWLCGVTVVRFTSDDLEVTSSRLRQLSKKWHSLDKPNIQFKLDAMPVRDWFGFNEGCAAGEIRIGGVVAK